MEMIVFRNNRWHIFYRKFKETDLKMTNATATTPVTATKRSAAAEAFAAVKEQIVNSDPQSLHTMEPKDEWRQGDVRIVRLPDDFDVAKYCDPMKETPTQLAPGNTQGSRHCLDSVDGIVAYQLKNKNELDGPVLHLTKERTITHPEHGNCTNLPAGFYAFPGQRVYAEEVRRARD